MIHRYIIEVTDEVKGFEKAIEKLEREWGIEELEPCEDAISRAEALRIAKSYYHAEYVVDKISQLPPVTPKGASAMNINIPDQREVILHYGQDNQFGIHMEECAELIQAISKARRWIATSDTATIHPSIINDLVEEMADVLICMKQLQEIFNITDEMLEKEVKAKFDRQLERMKEEVRKEKI